MKAVGLILLALIAIATGITAGIMLADRWEGDTVAADAARICIMERVAGTMAEFQACLRLNGM